MFVFLSVFGCSVIVSAVFAAEINLPNEPTAEAKIAPNGVLLFRFKREPQRAMTFTGFMPNGGMTAFSAAADSYQNRMMPTWYSKPSGPSDTLTPPTEADQGAAEHQSPEQAEPMWAKQPSKKKPYHPSKYYPATTADEDEEEYEAPSKSKSRGGSATASFNAWFPIMFGGFPNQYNGRNVQENSPNNYDQYNQNPGRSSQYPGQTVIANSVSNGKGGVASSHAIAYGNGPEGRSYNKDYNKDYKEEAPKMQGW